MPERQASCNNQAQVQTLKLYVNCWQFTPKNLSHVHLGNHLC
jgi:hypothetical protein